MIYLQCALKAEFLNVASYKLQNILTPNLLIKHLGSIKLCSILWKCKTRIKLVLAMLTNLTHNHTLINKYVHIIDNKIEISAFLLFVHEKNCILSLCRFQLIFVLWAWISLWYVRLFLALNIKFIVIWHFQYISCLYKFHLQSGRQDQVMLMVKMFRVSVIFHVVYVVKNLP